MKRPSGIIHIICAAFLMLLLPLSACSGNESATENGSVARVPSGSSSTTENTAGEASSDNGSTTENSPGEATTGSGYTTQDISGETTTVQEFFSREITLATLNIKHGAEGLDTVATAIREVSPDIIGLEEVDVNCERSGFTDEPAELAQMAGYSYYSFSKAIDLGDGEYGTAILSRYPIVSFEVIPLESGDGEGRSLGHAVISVDDLELNVFVTHLSYESRSLRITQMESIAERITCYDHYVLLGDLNSFNLEDIEYLNADYYVNRPDRQYTTFRRRDMALDNIVVSKTFTELTSGVSERECSDHKLVFATFLLTREPWGDGS